MNNAIIATIVGATGLVLLYGYSLVGSVVGSQSTSVIEHNVVTLDRLPGKESPADHRLHLTPNESTHGEITKERPETAVEALRALQQGNRRFVEGRSIHPHESTSYRASLANEQHPFATVLACSDSRVTPVLIFDQGIGDLFVIRVAGNIVDDDVAGSIEYAVDHLNAKLLVVMGHENCGAVTAAYHSFVARDYGSHEPREIESLLARIEPSLKNIDRTISEQQKIAWGVEENVRESVRQLLRIPDLRQAHQDGRMKVVGAIYSLSTGEVKLLKD